MDTAIIFSLMGPDGSLGTDDDVDADFGIDNYFFEGFFGIQDTLNVIAFGLATGKGTTAGATSAPSTTRSFTEPSSLNAIGLIEPDQAGISRAFPSLLTTSVPSSTCRTDYLAYHAPVRDRASRGSHRPTFGFHYP